MLQSNEVSNISEVENNSNLGVNAMATAKQSKTNTVRIPVDLISEIEILFPNETLSVYCAKVLWNEVNRIKAVRIAKGSDEATNAVLATIDALKEQNESATTDMDKVYINLSSIKRNFKGYAKKDGEISHSVNAELLKSVLASKEDELKEHHAKYDIGENHNLLTRRK
jgi:hypothetical protein